MVGIARTRLEMGEMAAALDAEYASTNRYPDAEAFRDFVRHWVRPKGPKDPYYDRWHQPYRYRVDGARYELLSCGPDGACGTPDDIRRQGGFATIQTPPP